MSNESFGQRYLSGLLNTGSAEAGMNLGRMSSEADADTDADAYRHLAEALAVLRAELAALLERHPDAVAPDDAADARQALAEAEDELASPEPSPGRLRRRIGALTDALSAAPQLFHQLHLVQEAAVRLWR